MRILVTGGTGFIGQSLCQSLTGSGHEVVVLTRHPQRQPPRPRTTYLSWETSAWQHAVGEVDAVVNLAGEPLVDGRWSLRRKLQLWESRVGTTHRLIGTMAVLPKRPAVLINASAVGYYGPQAPAGRSGGPRQGDAALTESDPPGKGFLADLCREWEAQARRAEPLGVRVVRLRIGVVLSADGGALAKMVPTFRWFVGGPLGSGRQWMSWIHRDDVVGLLRWALESPQVRGAVNATAPEPTTMRELARTLAAILRRPSWAPVPAFILRILLGEVADVLLTGQRVVPAAALSQGYTFRYPHLQQALAACLGVPGVVRQ